MRTFALGIGECGRRLGLELFRTTTVNTLQDINKMHDFALMDLTEIEKQLRDVTEMGVPESYANVIRLGEAEHQAGHNLFLGRIWFTDCYNTSWIIGSRHTVSPFVSFNCFYRGTSN